MAEKLEYTSKYDGKTSDAIMDYSNKLRQQTSVTDADTVQVFDTSGNPHKISKTELLKKSALALPSLNDISAFVAVNQAGNAIGLMTKQQVATVLGELIGIDNTWFRRRRDITIPNWNNISNLDSATESGMYVIRLESGGIWGIMVVFNGSLLQGCAFQILLYNGDSLRFRRRGNNTWTDWRTFSFT